jgi:uncharacterized metal-binding protein YceD (DUF177 family)
MASKRLYEIAFVGLRHGEHEFNYELEDKFFIEKGTEDVENMHANVKLLLEKNRDFMLLKFQTGGTAQVNCDRCGNLMQVSLWDEFNVVVKLVENPEEMNAQEEDADVFYIGRGESHLDVSDWLYEFALLSIPTQHVCGNDEKGESLCNKEVLKKLEEMKATASEQKENSIWKGLEKFKDN